MTEQTKMDELIEKLQEHVCDNLCKHPIRVGMSQVELEGICAECKMGELVCGILNEYNRYTGFVRCAECEYRAYEMSTDTYWCRTMAGIDAILKSGDGCSRGKRRETAPEVVG